MHLHGQRHSRRFPRVLSFLDFLKRGRARRLRRRGMARSFTPALESLECRTLLSAIGIPAIASAEASLNRGKPGLGRIADEVPRAPKKPQFGALKKLVLQSQWEFGQSVHQMYAFARFLESSNSSDEIVDSACNGSS